MSDETPKCLKCGSDVNSNDIFCPKCGRRLDFSPEEIKNREISKKQKNILLNIILVILGVALIFLLLAGSVLHLSNSPTTSTAIPTTTTDPVMAYTYYDITGTPTQNVCYWDWTSKKVSEINDYSFVATRGHEYVIVTLYLDNEADKTISTNPYYWYLTADGIRYSPDPATYSDSIGHQTVDVGNGGKLETQFIYLVNGDPSGAYLEYKGFSKPAMQRIIGLTHS